MVLAHGNAPRSIGYQPIALLLSYTRKNWRRAEDLRPNRQSRSVCFRNSARTSAGSLSKVAESSGPAPQALRLETASNRSPRFAVLLSKKMAEARGHAPQRRSAARSASNGCRRLGRFDSLRSPLRGRPSVDPSPLRSVASESPRGRICTCVGPLRRRRPELLGHAEMKRGSAKMAQPEQSEGSSSGCPLAGRSANKVDLAAGLPPTTRRSKRRMIVISPREEESGPFTRTCTSISGFAGPRPIYWTMKGEKESRTRIARAGLRQIFC
jgi:hypothetical protein